MFIDLYIHQFNLMYLLNLTFKFYNLFAVRFCLFSNWQSWLIYPTEQPLYCLDIFTVLQRSANLLLCFLSFHVQMVVCLFFLFVLCFLYVVV